MMNIGSSVGIKTSEDVVEAIESGASHEDLLSALRCYGERIYPLIVSAIETIKRGRPVLSSRDRTPWSEMDFNQRAVVVGRFLVHRLAGDSCIVSCKATDIGIYMNVVQIQLLQYDLVTKSGMTVTDGVLVDHRCEVLAIMPGVAGNMPHKKALQEWESFKAEKIKD